jgi:hypothetical protein
MAPTPQPKSSRLAHAYRTRSPLSSSTDSNAARTSACLADAFDGELTSLDGSDTPESDDIEDDDKDMGTSSEEDQDDEYVVGQEGAFACFSSNALSLTKFTVSREAQEAD